MTRGLKPAARDAPGELRFTINELAVSAVPGTCFIVYTPQDEPTRDALARLAAAGDPSHGPG